MNLVSYLTLQGLFCSLFETNNYPFSQEITTNHTYLLPNTQLISTLGRAAYLHAGDGRLSVFILVVLGERTWGQGSVKGVRALRKKIIKREGEL